MKFFKKKPKHTPRELPPWEEVVKMMYDKDLHAPCDYEIIDVIYSTDKAHRYLILKSDDLLTYRYERLQACDEYELLCLPDGALPAYWLPHESGAKPIFNDLDILMRELKAEPLYKTYFDNNTEL